MFPEAQAGPQTGNGYSTSSINQQNNSLLGNPQTQSAGVPLMNPSATNTTDPMSAGNPQMANMIKALRGGIQ